MVEGGAEDVEMNQFGLTWLRKSSLFWFILSLTLTHFYKEMGPFECPVTNPSSFLLKLVHLDLPEF